MTAISPALPKQALPQRYLSGVCQIHSTLTAPEHSRPWVKERNTHSKGSGFIIPGRLIVTNAHCINYASVVKVQAHMSDEKITARVLRINSDCDVAVLTVDDPDFWMMSDPDSEDPSVKIELPAFEFGELPELQDTVRVVGYELLAYFLASSLCFAQHFKVHHWILVTC
jgi:S1-C subfamily serine protease